MPDVKIIVAAAVFAFVISLISGIIGGVGFLTVIFRAVLGAVFFALIAAGLSMLLQKMIPELFETEEAETIATKVSTEGEEQVEAARETGGNVDITLGEEGEEASEGIKNEAIDDEQEEESFIEEVAEEEGNSPGETGNGEGGSTEPPKKATDMETLIGSDDVDSLPDLEDFADSFEGVASSQDGEGNSDAGAASGSRSGDGFSSSEPVDVFGSQEDPETVAKALRTFMKKDQEG